MTIKYVGPFGHQLESQIDRQIGLIKIGQIVHKRHRRTRMNEANAR